MLRPCPEPNPKGTARFTKAVRLRHRHDFLRAQAQGKRLHTRHFGVVLAPMAEGHPRLGLVVTKRLGKAVQRNRVKRVLREFFRRHQAGLPAFDLVIMAKKGAPALEYHQVEAELGRLLLSRTRQRIHD
ncbi:MAG: ribonuclease P protein component [Desulfobaccales bacterium]